jgi:hypothetical protein
MAGFGTPLSAVIATNDLELRKWLALTANHSYFIDKEGHDTLR